MDFSKENISKAKESFMHKDPGDGKRGPFYNKTQSWLFDVENRELFINAVWQGYLDASRTFSGIKGTNKSEGAFLNLAVSLQNYFKDSNAEFTHETWCTDFITDIKNCYNYEARYGQAQKVINMAFKYLYCCEGAEKHNSKFMDCHMPLDQYTLVWFFMEGNPLYQGWSWFDKTTYNRVCDEIKNILKASILDKELVIWDELKDKIIDLKMLNNNKS